MSVLTTADCKGSRLTSQKKLPLRIAEVSITLESKVITECRPAEYKSFTKLTATLLLIYIEIITKYKYLGFKEI